MTTASNVALRNAQMDAISTYMGNGAKLTIYSGTRPATGGAITSQVALAVFTCGSPFAPASSNGVLSPTLPSATTGAATGTATWFRITKADGTTHAIDGDVGTSGADLNLNTTSIVSGTTVSLSAWAITRGNP